MPYSLLIITFLVTGLNCNIINSSSKIIHSKSAFVPTFFWYSSILLPIACSLIFNGLSYLLSLQISEWGVLEPETNFSPFPLTHSNTPESSEFPIQTPAYVGSLNDWITTAICGCSSSLTWIYSFKRLLLTESLTFLIFINISLGETFKYESNIPANEFFSPSSISAELLTE